MSKRKVSAESSKPTKPSKRLLADDILDSFEQAIAYQRGEIKLRTRQIYVPDADVGGRIAPPPPNRSQQVVGADACDI